MFAYCDFIFVGYLFFFFKQKTAYEMRISDWSSDVCSSDLFNFSIGGNYTKFRTQNDYYVMSNILTAIARLGAFGYNGETGECEFTNYQILGAPNFDDILFCPYIDPNPEIGRAHV